MYVRRNNCFGGGAISGILSAEADYGRKAWLFIMDRFYELVNREEKKTRDTRMWILVGILAAVVLMVGASAVWLLGYHGRFTDFVGRLSASTTYASKNNSLIATVEGRRLRVSEQNMYGIYAYLSLSKSGRESAKIPQGEPVTLDYGDGTVLRLWDMPVEKDERRRNLFVQYTDIRGEAYSYISYNTTLDTVVVRYLTYDNEELSGEEGS